MLRRNRSRGSTARRTNNHNNGGHNGGRPNSERGIYERPESRPRYAVASQNYERYMNQAKEALGAGDRVQAEYYYQHADHFLRILNEYREQREAQQANQAAMQTQETTPVMPPEAATQPSDAGDSGMVLIDDKSEDGVLAEERKEPRRAPVRRQRPKPSAAVTTDEATVVE